MPTTFLECALNGPWSRAKQPLMPITPEELITPNNTIPIGVTISIHCKKPKESPERV